jgi:hypothetical protein
MSPDSTSLRWRARASREANDSHLFEEKKVEDSPASKSTLLLDFLAVITIAFNIWSLQAKDFIVTVSATLTVSLR